MTLSEILIDAAKAAHAAGKAYNDPDEAEAAMNYLTESIDAAVTRIENGDTQQASLRRLVGMLAFKANACIGSPERNTTRASMYRLAAHSIAAEDSWQTRETSALMWAMTLGGPSSLLIGCFEQAGRHRVVVMPVDAVMESVVDVRSFATADEAQADAVRETDDAEQGGYTLLVPPRRVEIPEVGPAGMTENSGFGALLLGAMSPFWPSPEWWRRIPVAV